MPARGFTRVHDTDQSTQVVQQRAWQNREEYRPSGREEYRDAARCGPPLRRWGGRPAGSGNLRKETAEGAVLSALDDGTTQKAGTESRSTLQRSRPAAPASTGL
jgi:hypothetical protein